MGPDSLKRMFGLSSRAVAANLDGVTHEDSLWQPPGGGNCVNWIVGHLLVHRDRILQALGAEPACPPEMAARYDRGTPPIIADGPDVVPLETLRELLATSQQRLESALGGADAALLSRELPFYGGTAKAETIAGTLLVHEGYHAGQLGILRRVHGMPGAIR